MIKILSVWVCFLLFNLFFSTNSSYAAISSDIAKLERGEVITKRIPSLEKGGVTETQAKVLINVPPEKLWCFLEKCDNYPSFINKLESMKVIESNNEYQKVKASVKIARFLPSLDYIIIMDKTKKYRVMKFKKIAGTIKTLDGTIELKPHNESTILTYKMHVESGIYIPEFIKSRGLKKDLPEIMTNIKYQAENS